MTDSDLLAWITEAEAVSVTQMVQRLGRPDNARRTLRGHLKRLVRVGLLQCRARDTTSGRGGRVIFWRTRTETT